MKTLIEKFNTTNLDALCGELTKEIEELASVEHKLKLLYVLVHIIDECQKHLKTMDKDYWPESLKKLLDNACAKSEEQLEVLKTRHRQDKAVRDAIDGNNHQLSQMGNQIESLLADYEAVLKQLVEARSSLSLPEREFNQKQS